MNELNIKWKIFLGALSFIVIILVYSYISHKQHMKNKDDRTIPTLSQFQEGIKTLVEPQKEVHVEDIEEYQEISRGNVSAVKRVYLRFLVIPVKKFFAEKRMIVTGAIATLTRLFLGMGIAILSSLILGILIGKNKYFDAYLSPTLIFLAKIPPTAMLALFFILCGLGMKMFLLNIVFGVLPALTQSVYLGVKDVHHEYIDKARTLGASYCEEILEITFKMILPRFLNDIRLQLGNAMVYLICAETQLASRGFGYIIQVHYKRSEMPVVFPVLVILGLLGIFMDSSLKYVLKKMCPWYGKGG